MNVGLHGCLRSIRGIRVCFLAVVCLWTGALTCSPLPTQMANNKVVDDRTKAIRQLIDAADSLPIEFRADIQLNAVESGALPPGEVAKGVVERLIESAGGAKNAYPLGRAFLTADTMENDLSSATQTLSALDALSVRTRAISALTKMDRAKALVALREIQVHIPPTTCASALIPDVTTYYEKLGALAGTAFSSVETNNGENVAWYEDNIRNINSALQLAPIAEFLSRAPLSTEQFDQLSNAYAAAFAGLRATDREMAWVYAEDRLPNAILELATRRKRGALPIDVLFLSYRDFLVRSAEETRCGDQSANWEVIVAAFNHGRESLSLAERVPALTANDVQRKGAQGDRAQMRMIPDVKEFDLLFGKIYALREKSGARATPEQQAVDTEAWESDAAQLLRSLDEYDPSKKGCVECAEIAKVRMLLGFFDFCPDDALKGKILSRLVKSLATTPLQTQEPVEWLFHMKLLLNISRKARAEQIKKIQKLTDEGRNLNLLPSNLAGRIRDEMKRAGDYTMYVYVDADEIFGNGYYSPYLQ